MRPSEDIFARMLARVGIVDLAASGGLTLFLTPLGLVSTPILVGALAVRALTWIAFLAVVLRPVRAWQRDREAVRDATLRDVDDTLLTSGGRFILVYVGGWLLSVIVAMGASSWSVGAASGEHSNAIDVLAVSLVLAGLVPIMTSLILPLLGVEVMAVRLRLGEQMLARGMEPRRTQGELRRRQVVVNVGLAWGVLVATIGGGLSLYAASVRDQARVELREHVAVAAARADAGLENDVGVGLEVVDEAELPPALARALGERGDEAGPVSALDGEVALAAAPLADGRWITGATTIDQHLGLWLLFLLVFLPVAIVPGVVASHALGQMVTAPLDRLDEAARELIERGDLGSLGRIPAFHDDQIGRLTVSFNAIVDNLEELAQAAKVVATGDLRAKIDAPGDLHDAFRGMLAKLDEVVARIRETSLELASAATEIEALTARQDEAAQRQAVAVHQVSATVTKLASSADDIAKAAGTVLDNADEANATTGALVVETGKLEREVERIGELLELIREVADRSDLLALNGALEATRAGEAGRGFALVASEMRRLAERVTGAVADVRERISQIESAGSATHAATEASRVLVQGTAAAARAISESTHMQSVGTVAAIEGVDGLARTVEAAASATAQTRAAAEGLRVHALELERLLARFTLAGDAESDAGR